MVFFGSKMVAKTMKIIRVNFIRLADHTDYKNLVDSKGKLFRQEKNCRVRVIVTNGSKQREVPLFIVGQWSVYIYQDA